MSLDDVALALQGLIDRFIRWLRIGPAPATTGRRLLVVQIDGLSHTALEQAIREGRMPFLARLMRRTHRLEPMTVGMPTSTPAFQMAAMYGVRPDIPGFHFHDKRRRVDIYFPRGGDAAHVEREQANGRLGIVTGGSTYGCVFTGGASHNLFSFAMIKRPSGSGILTAVSAFVVLTWVVVKCLALTVVELVRFLARIVANPLAGRPSGWRWLAIKVGMSIWMRQLFTLSAARDVYAGVPAIYVNYLDYDVYAHGFGPRDRRARRVLRRVDSAIRQLWRVCRRVSGHGYDLFVLSDHGQAHCKPFQTVSGGRALEHVILDEFFDAAGRREDGGPRVPYGIARLLKTMRNRNKGLFQRFVNYLDEDFGSQIDRAPETAEGAGVRVVSAGPNAFVYFLDTEQPLTIDEIDVRHPHVAEDISRLPGVGFVLARSAAGPVCAFRGKRYRLEEEPGPFAGRSDLDIVVDGIRDLMAMRTAGDLVIYGNEAAGGDVSFITEIGAHAGPSYEELHTFIIAPTGVALPTPIRHPIQLYDVFVQYQRVEAPAA